MANKTSQMKRNRQNIARRGRNRAVRSNLKTHLRAFERAQADGDRERADAAFQAASRRLDKAVAKGVVHRNYAANQKSRMAKALTRL